MKKILTTIIILFFSTHVFPQKDTATRLTLFDTSIYVFDIYDTIPVWIQCEDTTIHYQVYDLWHADSIQPHAGDTGYSAFIWHGHTIHDTTDHWTNNSVYGIRGFEVRKNNPTYDSWSDEHQLYAYMGWRDHFTHILFLDEKKKPLIYYVWTFKTLQ